MSILGLLLLSLATVSHAQTYSSAQDLANALGFSGNPTSLSFPPESDAPLSNSKSSDYIIDNWSVEQNKIQFGANGLRFIQDPASSSNGSTSVLSVDYPAGSYSHKTGGTQFTSDPFTSTAPSAMLSYKVFIPSDFNYMLGGKLPGLRGGDSLNDCSGGSQADGKSCFSARIMWRQNGQGEVYAYIPAIEGGCTKGGFICNSDYGTSIGRGKFSFQKGAWNEISLVVRLNEPVDIANGKLQLYYNGVEAFEYGNMVFRTSEDIKDADKIYFSTFFGGNDASWASPTDQTLQFKDIAVWGMDQAAPGGGPKYKLKGGANALKAQSGLTVTLIGVAVTGLIAFLL